MKEKEIQVQNITKNKRLPIPYLSRDVKYGTDGNRCVTIHLKLTDVKSNKPVTWHLNCGAAGSNANGTKPSTVIRKINI